jgi:hypothetical protein
MDVLNLIAFMTREDAIRFLNLKLESDISPNFKKIERKAWRDPKNHNFVVGFSCHQVPDERVERFHITGSVDARGVMYSGYPSDRAGAREVCWSSLLIPHLNPPMLAVALQHHFIDIPDLDPAYKLESLGNSKQLIRAV